jgi:TPP-dependent pyruvate/acetoin dehydrogenase alpha subunit
VPPGELEEWEARDPVDRYVAARAGRRLLTQKELDAMDERVAQRNR